VGDRDGLHLVKTGKEVTEKRRFSIGAGMVSTLLTSLMRPATPREDRFLAGHGQLHRRDDGAYVIHVSSESSLFMRQLGRR
jgi:hypothetical protein